MSGRSEILRHLEPVARPAAAARPGPGRSGDLEHGDFHTLIATAQQEIVRTNRPVRVPEQIVLTAQEQSRLERAADAALTHDSSSALVLLDGRPLLLDVRERSITEEVRAAGSSDRILTDIDTVIISGAVESDDGAPAHELLLRQLSGGNSLSRLLAETDEPTIQNQSSHTPD